LYLKPLDLSSYGTTIAKARQMMEYCINDYLQNEMDLKSKLMFYKKYGHGLPNACRVEIKKGNYTPVYTCQKVI